MKIRSIATVGSRILGILRIRRPIQSILLFMVIGLIGLPAVCRGANLKYSLDVKVDAPEKKITGVAHLRVDFDEAVDRTSLGHEILHQWFGNSVLVDYPHGNWSEGLTSYLSDHHYAERDGEDIAYRKQFLVDYHAYVNANNALPLSDFQIAGNKAQRAVGYGKSAMLFHGLRKRFGEKTFFQAIRQFIRQNSFRRASWHDIQRAFERETGETLYTEFGHWLTRADIPHIGVEDSELFVEQGRLRLRVTLAQKGEPYPLRLPFAIHTDRGKSERWVEVIGSRETVTLELEDPPTRVVIDENYDLMRRLNSEEIPPVLAAVMGEERLTAVVAEDRRAAFQPLIDALGVKEVMSVDPGRLCFQRMESESLLIAGYDLTLARMLFGEQAVPADGVRLKVYKHPYNPEERIVLLHAQNTAEAHAAASKIAHYGKYSELAFENGRNTLKAITDSDNGIFVFGRPAPLAVKPDKVSVLADIIPELSEKRVIYVGEQHDRFAHHLNQLQIIKKLNQAGYGLAVGMEAFQIPFQQTIDDYLAGRIDERTFLEESGYFCNWGYDYNLYKPIIDYLKQERIPMIALNIAGGITRKVSRKGIHNLADEEKQLLPSAMDFSNEDYRRDLHRVFELHAAHGELDEFDYFMQAQTIWDEIMAQSAQQFLTGHPERKLIVLAGNGHLRRKYGIPERLHRRNGESFVVVVQDEPLEAGLADYVLLTTPLKGVETPRLGVVFEEKARGLTIKTVVDHSLAAKSGLQKGDVIIRFSGQPIKSSADLKLALFYAKTGKKVSLQIERDQKLMDKEIELF